jgi:hypothetical protein
MSANAAHQRRADALNAEHIYPDRALAACACYALAQRPDYTQSTPLAQMLMSAKKGSAAITPTERAVSPNCRHTVACTLANMVAPALSATKGMVVTHTTTKKYANGRVSFA